MMYTTPITSLMPAKNKMDFKKVQTLFFFSMIILFAIAVLYIFAPFFYPLFWAAVLAILFYPTYLWLDQFFKLPRLSAFITLIIVVTLVFIPLFVVALILVNESALLYAHLAQSDIFGNVQTFTNNLNQLPVVGPYIDLAGIKGSSYATNAAKDISLFLFNNIKDITQNSIRFIVMFLLMTYTLFYFLKDGKRMLSRLMHLCPLGDEYEAMLYQRFTSTARATLKSTIIIGVVQGTIGGILFWITGIEGAFIWGILMIFLSLIPAFGASVVWFPAGVIMLALGNVWQGVTILVGGMFFLSLIDNLIRGPLVGKDTQMHPILVLFSTLGGIALFGISGFVIGPVITALFTAVMTIYEHYYKKELQSN